MSKEVKPDTVKNIYQRILAVMKDVEYIQKLDKTVNKMYRFVSHDQVSGALHPAFVKHGIVVIPNVKSLTQNGTTTIVCMEQTFVNADNPSDCVKIESWGYGVDPGDKGPGKAVSYACKYGLLKMFCLETGDDPDFEPEVIHSQIAPQSRQNEEIAPTLNLETFLDKVLTSTGEDLHPVGVKNYLTTLAKPHLAVEKIMGQALRSPEMTRKFINSFNEWSTTNP